MQINQRKYLVHITESIPTLPQALWEVADTGLLIHVSLIPLPTSFPGLLPSQNQPHPLLSLKGSLKSQCFAFTTKNINIEFLIGPLG